MTDTVFIVDDDPRILEEARMALEMNGYHVITAPDGYEALQVLEHTRPDLVISALAMPGCDGITLLEAVGARFEWIAIPFVFLTDAGDEGAGKRCQAHGVRDYLEKPVSPEALVQTVMDLFARTNLLQLAPETEAVLRTLVVMAKTIEARDRSATGHVERVGAYAQALAQALGWDATRLAQLKLAAILHDIGKIMIPDSVLNKSGDLSPEEWQMMRTHPDVGADLVLPLKELPVIEDGVRCHHERFDGQGYPRGLAGEDIPEAGRVLALVDAFDAMTSHRPYRKTALPVDTAIEHLKEDAGKQFDPKMVEVFIATFQSQDGDLQFPH